MLREHGVEGGRLNFMWSNRIETKKYELTSEEASHAWLYLYKNLREYIDLQWQPFREFTDNFLGFSHSSCSFGKCDYFCTSTKVILPDGSLGNCDRTHQEGSTYTRAPMSYERYEALKETDCRKCRFWDACYGGCPSEDLDGDWRNQNRWCQPIYDLYKAIEFDIKKLLPNMKLVTNWTGPHDYFETIHQGKSIEAFEKMSFTTTKNPSSWKFVQLKDNNHQQNKAQQPPAPIKPKSNFANHGDNSC